MTVLVPTPGVRPQGPAPDPARTLDTLVTVLGLVLTVVILYLAREILVPIAIAILLSFVLSPPIKLLRSLGINKPISVALVVCLSFSIAVGLGFMLTKQITDLAADAPRYQATVTAKTDAARAFVADSPLLAKLSVVAADMSKAPSATDKNARPASPTPSVPAQDEADKPLPVQIVAPPPGVLSMLQTLGGVAASPLTTAAFVALFVVFILMQREDLRNRFIRLVGSGDLNRTTLAMNEAAGRLSRYFLAQVLLNTSFGVVVAISLAVIGVPSPILWGIVASLMRFIPYLGAVGAAFFPLLMATAASPGWSMVIETAVLFAAIELVTGQIIEPLVYGRNTGISPIAVVASATFWTWLWGPVGLVLATPLTVCLVVMGRHVERFSFFNVILSDAPPLTAAETFYQRMLVGDPSEIVDHAEEFLREHSLLDYCDGVAMKALLMAQSDVRSGALDEQRQARICDSMRDLVDDLADLDHAALGPRPGADAPAAVLTHDDDIDEVEAEPHRRRIAANWARANAVVCFGGRTPLDEAAAHILADLLNQHGIGVHVEPAQSLAANKIGHLAEPRPELIVLSFLDADLSVAQARLAVRRIRRHIPNVPMVAAFWMPQEDYARVTTLCSDVRSDMCVASLPEALTLCLDRAAAPVDEADAPANIASSVVFAPEIPAPEIPAPEIPATEDPETKHSADQGPVRQREPLPRELA